MLKKGGRKKMNEFQTGLLNELVAVKITTKEEFEKVTISYQSTTAFS